MHKKRNIIIDSLHKPIDILYESSWKDAYFQDIPSFAWILQNLVILARQHVSHFACHSARHILIPTYTYLTLYIFFVLMNVCISSGISHVYVDLGKLPNDVVVTIYWLATHIARLKRVSNLFPCIDNAQLLTEMCSYNDIWIQKLLQYERYDIHICVCE